MGPLSSDHAMFSPSRGMEGSSVKPSVTDNTEDGREFLCGWGAAFVNITMTFPINKVIFRQQLYGLRMPMAVRQLQKEGLLHLYRGLMPPLLQKTTSMSIMFGMYDQFQRLLTHQVPLMPIKLTQASAAMLAGTTEALLAPLERVQTLMQDKMYQRRFTNTLHAFGELRTYGLAEYYRGWTAILLRNGPSNVPFFLLRGEIRELLPTPSTNSGRIAADFVSGALLGSLISTVFFPLNVVKTQMQCRVGGEFLTLTQAFHIVFEERGRSWRKMFRGVHLNYTRAMISWGIINAAYELLKRLLYYNGFHNR